MLEEGGGNMEGEINFGYVRNSFTTKISLIQRESSKEMETWKQRDLVLN